MRKYEYTRFTHLHNDLSAVKAAPGAGAGEHLPQQHAERVDLRSGEGGRCNPEGAIKSRERTAWDMGQVSIYGESYNYREEGRRLTMLSYDMRS